MKRSTSTLLLSGVVLGSFSCSAESNTPLNILLINVDDLGWSDLSFMGSTFYESPNIDQLRSESLYFPNGYAAAANSAPSRSSMLTGVYSPRHGVNTVNPSNRGKAQDRKFTAPASSDFPDPSYELLTERMQAGGYNVCHVGKWHLGDNPQIDQGVDTNIGGYSKGHPNSYFSPYNNPHLSDGENGEYLTDRLGDEVINFLSTTRDKTKPFFLYYATYSVHTPLQAKPELVEKYNAKEGKTDEHYNPKYAAMIESVDNSIGRVLEYLDESGLSKNTVVIFTSDNGGLYSVSKQHPLRAGKGSFYEGGIRVPFMVRWCGNTTPNSTDESVVSQIDLYPTILDITGVSNEGLALDGTSLRGVLDGSQSLAERSLYWHFPAYLQGGSKESTDPIFRSRPVSVVRRGEWKLIHNYESGTNELYNLHDDLSERTDLSSREHKKCDELYSDLQRWLSDVDAYTEFESNPKYQQ
ncbi:MAG: sulfatase [Rikenellaceae bacterium]